MARRTLRVLQICGSFTPVPCGIGDYTAHLVEALSKLDGVEAGVLTTTRAAAIPATAFEVIPIIDEWRVSRIPALMAAVRRWKPDIVHMQFPAQGYAPHYGPWFVPALLALQGYRIVQTWHEYFPARSGWRNILNALTPGGLVVVRPGYLDQMPPWYRRVVSGKHFQFIPNAAALPAVQLTNEQRARIRAELGVGTRSLVAYFGFIYPAKGTELLFDIASPDEDQLVLVAGLNSADPYHQTIATRIDTDRWRDRTVVTGFLPEHEAASILAAADAIVLPFTDGGGIWNTSVHASAKQGTFVLTTSRERRGYDSGENIFNAEPGNLEEMRAALRQHIGRRAVRTADTRPEEWRRIAEAHVGVYTRVLGLA
jgi:glycosyltransferase involved in cell wall biosynthesis